LVINYFYNKIEYYISNIMSKKAFIFPGQGAQFVGMGKDLYDQHEIARTLFKEANQILGFSITDEMFNGSDEGLKQTRITQPAIFLHSVIAAKCMGKEFTPDMVAGHSLGEFSALVANGTLEFGDGLKLVYQRAQAMQIACETSPGTMAAVLGLEDSKVEEICAQIKSGIVVPANYNCPGQLVISGDIQAIHEACEVLKTAGAKRALVLPVGGAFHSPLMKPAEDKLAEAIQNTIFSKPSCPIYQNVNAEASSDPETIKSNLLKQLTAPVKWTQSVHNMVRDGAISFTELGPGKVLQGLVKKIAPTSELG
jgi:[acyl-carrier-protein] S-malonyltransferase